MQTPQNRFLAALAVDALTRWQPRLEPVALQAGEVLQDFNQDPQHLYFPHTALVVLQQRLNSGSIADVALVGFDGIVGANQVFGKDATLARSVVLAPGAAQRFPVAQFRQELEADGAVLSATLRYLQDLVERMALTALCNLHHTPLQIMSRRVLELADRLPGATGFAQALCLQGFPSGATQPAKEALLLLCAGGVVQLEGEQVSVLQRGGLERHACGCYADARIRP